MKLLLMCGNMSQVTPEALRTVGADEVIRVGTLDGARKEFKSHASEIVGIVVDSVSLKISDAKRFVMEAHKSKAFAGFIVAAAMKANYMDQLCNHGADSAGTDREVVSLAQNKLGEFRQLISAHENGWEGLYSTITEQINQRNTRRKIVKGLLEETTPKMQAFSFA